MNVVEPILFQCKLNPLATAICVPGAGLESVTYGVLERFVHNVGRNAVKAGIAPGDLVGIYITDTILHVSLVLGLMYVGATTVSLRGTKEVPGIKPDLILTDVPGRFSAAGRTALSVDTTWIEGDIDHTQKPHRSDDNICRIILTSGSTGIAKGVAFSHEVLAARIAYYNYSKGPRYAYCPRFFCDLGFTTSPGFRYAMSLLTRGGTIYFLGPNPADILQSIDLFDIRGMATSPYALGEFLKFYEADSAFEVGFDLIICQGAMLSRELAQRARSRMCQNLYSSYGSTETTTVAFGPASVLEKTPGAVGFIQPGVTVEAVDGSGAVLPPLADGELRIRSSCMAAAYVGDPAATQQHFRDGYFYSGDIGHVTREGLLVITARKKTALNIGGDTLSPEVAEEVIASYAGVKEAGVFASRNNLGIDELHALVVTDTPIDHAALRNHCVGRLPPSCIPARFTEVEALPRGAQAKLERHRFPDLARAKTRDGSG